MDFQAMITSITPLGSGIYTVAGSDSSPFKHTVDLRAHLDNGSCTCSVFTGCCAFLLKHQRGAKRWRCDHINAARAWREEYEVPALVEQTEKIIEMPAHDNSLRNLGVLPDGG